MYRMLWRALTFAKILSHLEPIVGIHVKGDVDTWNMLTSPAEHVNIHIPLVWLQDYFQFGSTNDVEVVFLLYLKEANWL